MTGCLLYTQITLCCDGHMFRPDVRGSSPSVQGSGLYLMRRLVITSFQIICRHTNRHAQVQLGSQALTRHRVCCTDNVKLESWKQEMARAVANASSLSEAVKMTQRGQIWLSSHEAQEQRCAIETRSPVQTWTSSG